MESRSQIKADRATWGLNTGYDVVVSGGGTNNVPALGGATNETFDVREFGAGQKYQGFAGFGKTGTSTWTLTETTTALTPWTVRQGTLIGDAASIKGDLGNAGTVIFDQTTNASFLGDVAGHGGTNGAMTKRGAGILTLAGTSPLNWTIEAGGLVSAANRFGGNAAVGSGASFTFDQAGSGTYAGILSGSGAFAKAGSGVVLLTGDSSAFGGSTAVTGGRLIVGQGGSGALGGSLTIQSGGLLGGTDNLGSPGSIVTSAAGAVHAPGNSIGVQHVLGDYVNHGTLRIEATPSEADNIVVAGSVDIAGATLDVTLTHKKDKHEL